jgi:hypothetical protein
MNTIDWSKVTLHWYGTKPTIDNYEELVLKDCESNLKGLEEVSELVFHIIPLSKSYEYDIITVWGERGSENILYCEYESKPSWITLSEWKDPSNS